MQACFLEAASSFRAHVGYGRCCHVKRLGKPRLPGSCGEGGGGGGSQTTGVLRFLNARHSGTVLIFLFLLSREDFLASCADVPRGRGPVVTSPPPPLLRPLEAARRSISSSTDVCCGIFNLCERRLFSPSLRNPHFPAHTRCANSCFLPKCLLAPGCQCVEAWLGVFSTMLL